MQDLKPAVNRRQAVLVLGMHRSGTSALAGTLARLGVQPPKSLMAPTRDNPKGYWESTRLMRFHDEIMASAGTVWSDWDRFNPAWMASPVAEDFVTRLPRILDEEYGDAKLFLVKDPRICRLLPLWLHVLWKLEVVPKIVLPVRHPLEVANSLGVRNDFGRQRSCLIWLRHVLDAEYHSRGIERIVVDYPEMLADWRGVVARVSRELSISWPKWSSSVEADVDEFLSSGLRHHSACDGIPVDSTGIGSWVAQAHQALLQLARTGTVSDAATSVLDQVRVEFDKSSAVYAAVVREGEAKAQARIRELDGRMAEANDRHATLVKEVAALADAVEAGAPDGLQESSFASAELAPLVAQLKKAQTAQAERAAEAAQAAAQAAQAAQAAAIDRHASEIDSLRKAGEQAERSLQARFAEIAKLTTMVFDLQGQLAKERSSGASHRLDAEARLSGLEQELELCRRLAADRQEQLKRIQEGKLARAVTLLRRMRNFGRASAVASMVSDDETIRQSGLFDRDWYLQRYPDVRKKGMDPLAHYLRYGAKEGRDPGPGFGTRDYLGRYPDVAESGLNPLVHYIRYGLGEGRRARERKQGTPSR
jgi:hypothetical protein